MALLLQGTPTNPQQPRPVFTPTGPMPGPSMQGHMPRMGGSPFPPQGKAQCYVNMGGYHFLHFRSVSRAGP